jgi:phospholipase C
MSVALGRSIMRKKTLLALSFVAVGCSSVSSIGDQGEDIDVVTPNEPLQLTGNELEADNETAAQYAGATALREVVTASDEENGDVMEEAEEIDGYPNLADGAFPIEAVPESVQAAIPSKIKYVVVIVKENHSFDNYFTGFPGASWSKKAKLNAHETVCRPIAPDGALGTPCHSNCCGERAYANGNMDGFDNTARACGGKSSGHYPFVRFTEKQIPNYWKLASEYVLADHFFSTTLGPSSPGHEVFWFGQSTSIDNAFPTKKGASGVGCDSTGMAIKAMNPLTCTTQTVRPCFDLPSLPDHMPQGFTWMDYGGAMALQIKSVASKANHEKHFRSSKSLIQDIHDGKLANLTIAHISGGPASEHPPESPCKGENFTVDVLNELMALPQWNEMAVIVTWDDWGGFYDHVKPTVHECKNGKVFESGFRLPMILISPFAKKGFVLKDHVEQASVPKLIEDLWGMKYMHTRNKHARDAVAGSLLPAFDFKQKPRAPISLTRRSTCPDDSGDPATLHFPAMIDGKCD